MNDKKEEIMADFYIWYVKNIGHDDSLKDIINDYVKK